MQEAEAIQIVNQLFERLIAINPAFKQSWPTEEEFKATKKEWVIAFMEAKINSVEKLKIGLSKLRLHPSPFVPSPGQFIEMCKPSIEDLDAPALEVAFKEACKKSHPSYGEDKSWSHPAVRHAWSATGAHFLREKNETTARARFKENYEHALKLAANNELREEIADTKTFQDYQIYVSKLKSDIALGFKESQQIPSFSQYRFSKNYHANKNT